MTGRTYPSEGACGSGAGGDYGTRFYQQNPEAVYCGLQRMMENLGLASGGTVKKFAGGTRKGMTIINSGQGPDIVVTLGTNTGLPKYDWSQYEEERPEGIQTLPKGEMDRPETERTALRILQNGQNSRKVLLTVAEDFNL